MKKIKLIIAAVAMLSLVSSSAVYADGFAPAEGLYVGVMFGHNAGNVKAKVFADGTNDTMSESVTAEMKEGGLGLEGIEGGGYLGYGYKMGDLYAGLEFGMTAGGGEFELTTDRDITIGSGAEGAEQQYAVSSITAKTQWTAGGGARIGYYVNKDTLLAFKAGIAASEFDVKVGTTLSETYSAGGPLFGVSVDTRLAALDPNLSVRVAWDYIDYMTAPISGIGTETVGKSEYNSEVTGAAYSARVGLTYSFFDANSLF